MTVNRRQFLKLSAGATLAGAFGGLGISLAPSVARAELQKLQWAKQTTSVCCYCAVGCGLIVHTAKNGEGRAVNVEGDPDHPINEGALCPKGGSIFQLGENDARPKKPLYRAPNSGEWKEVEWDWALSEIAKRVKKTRDASFQTANAKGEKVNRTETIASLGSAALDNEECWAYQVILRSLGLVFIEHQARICHSSTVPALAETYGRGAMTNHWNDIANSDCVLIMGSNAAENHPISFKWVMRAKDRGATIVHVDPRFTRTASKSDIYAPMRSGIDIAFLGGLIKYILDNKLYFEEYVREYTNASLIVGEKFSFKDGLFSGFDAEKRKYDKSQWAFELDGNGVPKRDPSLKHPRCVFNLMKKHYERYTPEQVSNVTGTPKDQLLQVYKTYAATGKPDKAGTIMYAMGWTQHTVGVQNIRTMAMVQLLLGNIGVAGGGVNALRGESNVQGSTDQGLLAHIWPGYNPTPTSRQATLDEYNAATPLSKDPKSVNWWQNRPKYVASYLKAIYPGLSPAEAYDIMPKVDADKASTHYFWLNIFDRMDKGEFKGAFAWGMNPACGGANAGKNRRALGKLDWLVNVNIFENETSSFWKGPGTDPKAIGTEVFFLPCAVSIEKEGSIVNSGRWMQWRYRGPKPWGDTKPDGDIMLEMMHKIRDLYAKEGGAHPDPILKLNVAEWEEHNEFSPTKVARLMNGYFLKDTEVGGKQFKAGQMVPAFAFLTADGSTCSGNWLHAGSYTDGQAVESGQGRHRMEGRQVGGRRGGRRGRPRRQTPLHHADARLRRVVRAGARGRPLPRALRAHGRPHCRASLLEAAQQPRGVPLRRREEGGGGPQVPVHLLHLPGHRALADGPDDPPLRMAGGGAAAGVLRNGHRPRQAEGHQERRHGAAFQHPWRGGSGGHRHRAHQAVQGHGQGVPHGGPALALRLDDTQGRR
jgi:formate dehydrogenase major subunit